MKEDPEDIDNLEAIFHSALACDSPQSRAEYLAQVCGKDAALLERLKTLLKNNEIGDGFLENPPTLLDLPSLDTMPTESPGMAIGRYRLLEKTGEGGMATVFLAEQERPVHRQVALKVLKPGMDSQQIVARFEVERQALAMMNHPHIARIFDGGTTEKGRPYFVMEWVQGDAITYYCNQKHLGIEERLKLFVQVCNAVQHAHQQGVIHRDLKPSNVMVTLEDDRAVPKVIDFGIAKATNQRLTEKTLFTHQAQMIGTPAYMSPEQARMSGLDVDTRTDIYSLGVLLYELLTGTTPFDAKELAESSLDEMLKIIRERDPQKPSTRLTRIQAKPSAHIKLPTLTIDNDLDWIVMKALNKEADRRYETAQALAQDVKRYLHHEPIQARPPSIPYRAVKFMRRHRSAAVPVALVCAALTVGAAAARFMGVSFHYGVPQHAQGMIKRHLWNLPPVSSFSGGISSDGRYVSYIDWTAGNLAIQDLVHDTRWLVTQNQDSTWKTLDGWVESAAISPDGSQLAYAWSNQKGARIHDLRVIDRDGGHRRIMYHNEGTFWIKVYAWSPDGRSILAYFSDVKRRAIDESSTPEDRTGHLVLVSVTDGSVRIIKTWIRKIKPQTTASAFSPDGGFIAYDLEQQGAPGVRDIHLLDLETNQERTLIEHPADDRFVGWTPNGCNVLFTSDRGTHAGLWILAVRAGLPDGPPQRLLSQFTGSPIGLDEDGAYYYSVQTTTSNVYIAALDSDSMQFEGKPTLTTSRHIGSTMMASWSPDGQRLAYRTDLLDQRSNAFDDGEWALVIYDLQTGQERVLTPLPAFRPGTRMRGPWWSPNGDSLLVSGVSTGTGQGLYSIHADNGQTRLITQERKGRIFDAHWSPDRRFIYYVVDLNRLCQWEPATGKTMTLYNGQIDSGRFSLSPDGQWLAFWKEDTSLVRIRSNGGEPHEVVRLEHVWTSNPLEFTAWSPDGAYLLYPDQDRLCRIHLESGKKQVIGPALPDLIGVAMHPTGHHLALTIEHAGSEMWAIENFLPE